MNIEKTLNALNKKGFHAKYFENRDALYREICAHLDKSEQIGGGGSMTVRELDLYKMLKNDGFNVVMPDAIDVSYEDAMYKNRTADVYFSSVNAMSEDGVIVNIDGTGNRIGATCFGAKKLFYILGENKIEETVEKALWRARNVASPLNAKRLGRKTPCVVTGKCEDCASPERICRGFLFTTNPLNKKDTYVFILNESLGF